MTKSDKLKIFLGTLYLIIISVFLWYFFSYFTIEELTSYDFLKNNRDYLIEVKESNILLSSIIFFIFTVFWTLMLGFGSPILLLAGFIFGKWLGSLLAVFALSAGATLLYIFCNFYLKDLIKDKFSKKFSYLSNKFQKNEFNFFLIYRLIGGIPFAIANLLPIIFNISLKNYFFGTFFGILPSLFIIGSLGHGLEKTVQQNDQSISFIELILLPEIYTPILCFFLLMIISILARKIFYKN